VPNFVRRILLFLLALCFLLPVLSSAPLQAQSSVSGTITGVVLDPQGAALVGADITVSGSAMLNPKSQKSVAGGVFLIESLPPGEYQITCNIPGFKKASCKRELC
jgi:hypothetical protein